MKRCLLFAVACLLAAAVPAAGSDPAGPVIRLPDQPAPVPRPMPPAPADAGYPLAADELFVFDSDSECFTRCTPGLLLVTADTGPIRIRGKFAGGTGKTETRTFAGKYVYTVEAVATGRADLFIFPAGATKDADIRSVRIDANAGPRPLPPGPDPKPPEPKPDGTSPFAEAGFRVLISFDQTNTTRPPGEQSVLYGKAVRDYLEAHCVANTRGEKDDAGNVMKEYRIFPANTVTTNVPKVFADAWAKKGGSDWIQVGDGKTGYSGPLPKSEADALTLLRKFGGE